MRFRLVAAIWLLFLFPFQPVFRVAAQAPQPKNAADIRLMLQKLNVLGSALYIAAHPDDENTRLLAWLANEKKVDAAYLSLTRGDGGQNLIGPEIREQLGIIRTQELLMARQTDGAKQFFTRANDFGFSKDPNETFTIWNREQVLADMVYVIRKFRPDVLITRFSPEPGPTHGHHTASAMLALEAFEAAADKTRFPEQLTELEVWQPTRILWNTSTFFFPAGHQLDESKYLTLDVGGYNSLLGKSYPEIAAKSRSMHKSQGFGSAGVRGVTKEYFQHLKGPKAKQELFEDVNLSWNRVKGGAAVGKLVQKLLKNYDPENPAASVPLLLQTRQAIEKLPENHYQKQKLAEIDRILQACLGLYFEVAATDFSATPGETVKLTIEATNRSQVPVTLQKISLPVASKDSVLNQALTFNKPLIFPVKMVLPANVPYDQPYWLRQPGSLGMFTVSDPNLIGQPENKPAATVKATFLVKNTPLEVMVPVVYKRTDPVEGEQYRPFTIGPPVAVRVQQPVSVFADDKPKTIQVLVKAARKNMQGTVGLQVPAGWQVSPASAPFSLSQKGEETAVSFQVTPTKHESEGEVKAVATVNGQTYTQSQLTIAYNHIPTQTIYPEATAKVVKLDIKTKGKRIGYIMGAGDEVPASLEQIGYEVRLLQSHDLQEDNLKKFDAVVIGVRAFNTQDWLRFQQPNLLNYVKQGGTVVVQYNVNNGLVTPDLGPYPLKISRDRVTVEEAEVRFLQPEHLVLNYPNKITQKDFANWVQERGLYFPNEWDSHYQAILSSNDPGETPKDGGLLVAEYGKGYFIYTGYSWFRQLPAGVPGAYRIFTNLISIGKK